MKHFAGKHTRLRTDISILEQQENRRRVHAGYESIRL